MEENLALIQTIAGENSRAISTLTRVLQKPGGSFVYPEVITPALLRLDPLWDPLRPDPAFQKLCQEQQNKSTRVRRGFYLREGSGVTRLACQTAACPRTADSVLPTLPDRGHLPIRR